jgi:hypothetical protein
VGRAVVFRVWQRLGRWWVWRSGKRGHGRGAREGWRLRRLATAACRVGARRGSARGCWFLLLDPQGPDGGRVGGGGLIAQKQLLFWPALLAALHGSDEGGCMCVWAGECRGAPGADGDAHEHCRCTCKMYLAGTGYSGAREVLSSVAEARQTADGRRQTSTRPAGVNYVACRQRHWAAAMRVGVAHDAAAACHWPASCYEGAYTAALHDDSIDSPPPRVGVVPAWARFYQDRDQDQDQDMARPRLDRCIHPRSHPTHDSLLVKMLRPSTSFLAPHLTSTYHLLAALPFPLVTTSFPAHRQVVFQKYAHLHGC